MLDFLYNIRYMLFWVVLVSCVAGMYSVASADCVCKNADGKILEVYKGVTCENNNTEESICDILEDY